MKILILFTLSYFVCYFLLPQKIRFLLFIGIGFITVFLLKPKPGFWLMLLPFIFVAGGSILHIGEFSPAIATLVMIAFTLYYIADRVIYNKPLFVPSPYLFFFFVAAFIQICSILISIHLHEQHAWNAIRDGSSIFLFLPLAVIIPVLCSSETKFNQLLRAVVLALLAVSIIGVTEYFSISGFSRIDMGIGYIYRGRVASLFGNPNIFACYLEISIPLAIAMIFREKTIKWKIISAAAAILGILSVLYTFSRGGLVFTFIGCGIVLLYAFRSKIWISFLIVIGALLLLILNANTFERQMSFFMNPKEQLSQPTILHRYVAYQGCLNQFSESPVTGVGWGASEFYWGRSLIYSFWEVRHGVSSQTISGFGGLNSLLINHAVKGGIVSVVSVILIFATILATFFKAFRRGGGLIAIAIIAGILSFMGHQFIDNTLRFPTVNSLFWTVLGLLLILATSDSAKLYTEKGKE